SEKHEYMEIERRLELASLEPIEENNPGLAAALNILPGFGNVYLEQWGAFIGNLLLWPVSVVWGAPQAYIDAKTLNKQETLYFYKHGLGKDELAQKEGMAK
ncbi:hypothetical protein, partial [Oleiphilus sp. HI0043]|uniref:hypothetical protein n=2 Tax=Oleiphilus TaxID=141450 RepID=UPI000B1356F9